MNSYTNCFVFFAFLFKVVMCLEDIPIPDTYSYSLSDDIIPILEEPTVKDYNILKMSKNCTPTLEEFSEKVTNLTQCIVVNARPISLCVSCRENFKDTMEVYNSLNKVPCRQFYFESDQIGIINLVYFHGRDLWAKNSCENCQDYINDTLKFLDVANDLNNCFEIYNGTSPEEVNNTCKMCGDLFAKMNDIYKDFVLRISSDETGGVCMDIVDKMNITRHLWSRQNCLRFDSYVGYPNILTAVLVGAMPIFFYMLSKNISIIEDVKLVRPKRKSFTPLPPESLASE